MQPTVVISMEIELAWGVHHTLGRQGIDRHSNGRSTESAILGRLLSLCDELEIPITFNVVGHLLLDDCSGDHDSPHKQDWFESDPGTGVEQDPLYYAPDLIRRIQSAETNHEICSHSFSHTVCQEASEATIDWELARACQVHERYGFEQPTSFVPPMHAPCPPNQLQAHGFEGVRRPVSYHPPVCETDSPNSLLQSIPWRLKHSYPVEVLFRSHPVREPKPIDGLIEHYTSWHTSLTAPYLPNGTIKPHPLFRLLPLSTRQSLHKRYLTGGIARAMSENSCAHYWTHLFNLANDAQWEPVEWFLQEIADERTAGNLSVLTMESLTNRVQELYT